MKNKKNYTLYGLILLGAVLTVPIATLIMSKFPYASAFFKAFYITVVFLVLTVAIVLIYRFSFGVSMDEITQSKKLSELEKKFQWLVNYKKGHYASGNSMKRLLSSIDRVMVQVNNFGRRKKVFLGLLDSEQLKGENKVVQIAEIVENALDFNTDKIIDRIKIFDDRVQFSVVNQNLEYVEEYIRKNDKVLEDFERLMAEVSSMGDGKEVDLSYLEDTIQAMESLRTNINGEMDNLKKKYE